MTVREWWERLRTRGIVPSLPSVLFTALLLAMMGASILAGRQLTRSRESHKRATDEALKEYATFAARLFGERVFAASNSERMRASATVLAAPMRPGYSVSLGDYAAVARDVLRGEGHDVVGDSLLGFFKVSATRVGFEGMGAALRPAVRLQIDSTLDDVDPSFLNRNETTQRHRMVNGVPVTVVVAMQRDVNGKVLTFFGYAFSRIKHWEESGNRVLSRQPLLPPSLLDPTWRYEQNYPTDSLIGISVYQPDGTLLFRSRRNFTSEISGDFEFRTIPGGIRVVATLHPDLVAAVRQRLRANQRNVISVTFQVNGRERGFEIPVEILLPTLTVLLAIVAVLHLWRERSLVRARRDFVASVSHELRTPLAQIRMFTETLQLGRDRTEEERQQWLNIISREARRLGDLVENILLFSHIDADRAKLEKERTDLGELIEEVVEGFVPVAEQRGMRIVADAPSRIFSMVDPRAMRQIIVNLLDNALKYGPVGQKVSVDLERIGTVARITIADQGPGIEPGDRTRMWEPFVRLGKEAGITGGSGIGLAVVRALVEQQGGSTALAKGGGEGEEGGGGGARFVLEFEVSESAAGLPLRATGEFRTPRLPLGGAVSGSTAAIDPRTLAPRVHGPPSAGGSSSER